MAVKISFAKSSEPTVETTKAYVEPEPIKEAETPEPTVEVPETPTTDWDNPVDIPKEKESEEKPWYMSVLKYTPNSGSSDTELKVRYCAGIGVALIILFLIITYYYMAWNASAYVEGNRLDYTWSPTQSSLTVVCPEKNNHYIVYKDNRLYSCRCYEINGTDEMVFSLPESGLYCVVLFWESYGTLQCGTVTFSTDSGGSSSSLSSLVALHLRDMTDPSKSKFAKELAVVFRNTARDYSKYSSESEMAEDVRTKSQDILGFNRDTAISTEDEWQKLFGTLGLVDRYVKDTFGSSQVDWPLVLNQIADGLEKGIK